MLKKLSRLLDKLSDNERKGVITYMLSISWGGEDIDDIEIMVLAGVLPLQFGELFSWSTALLLLLFLFSSLALLSRSDLSSRLSSFDLLGEGGTPTCRTDSSMLMLWFRFLFFLVFLCIGLGVEVG